MTCPNMHLWNFWLDVNTIQGDRSPNNAEREDTGISKSWLHHKGRNKHHFEYWVDYAPGDEHIINGVPMPRKYIAEMVMDRISASRNYLGDKYDQHQPLDYYLKGKEKLWFIHPKTKRDLEGLLRILNDHGEEVLISYIKNVYLKKDKTLTGRKHTAKRECKQAGRQEQINF